jgi:hypothetical protein
MSAQISIPTSYSLNRRRFDLIVECGATQRTVEYFVVNSTDHTFTHYQRHRFFVPGVQCACRSVLESMIVVRYAVCLLPSRDQGVVQHSSARAECGSGDITLQALVMPSKHTARMATTQGSSTPSMQSQSCMEGMTT